MDLASIYKEYGFPALTRFMNIVKQNKLNFTRQQVKEFLAKQKVAQLHKPTAKNKKLQNPITSVNPDFEWQMDLLDFSKFYHKNQGYKWILIAIDIFSRFAHAVALKSKTTADVEVGLKKLLQDNQTIPKIISTDDGSEWKAQVAKLMKDKDIYHRIANVGDHNRLGIVDRFSQTIKNILYKHMTAENSTKWIDSLPKFIEKYNHTPHSTLCDMNPATAVKRPIAATKCHLERLTGVNQYQVGKINVGDLVRIKLKQATFSRGYEIRWSAKQYKVIAIEGLWYELDNGNKYRLADLQKVAEVPEEQQKIKQVVKKAKRKYKQELLLKREDIKPARIQRQPRFKNYIPASILEEGADVEFEQPKAPVKKAQDKLAKLQRELKKLQ